MNARWLKSNMEDEIDQLINLETANRNEIVTRNAILIFMCLIGAAYFQIWFPVIWIFCYVATSRAVWFAFTRLSQHRRFKDYVAVLSITFVQLLTSRLMILYLWFFPHPAAHYIGFFMLLASMRSSVNFKARVKSYMLLHAKGDITVFAVLAYHYFFHETSFDGGALIGAAIVCMIIYYVITLRQNLTYLKDMQLLEESTRQSQKMEAVGRLTGGVAHDFNNILTVVMGNLELHEMTKDHDEKRELLQKTRDAARRAADLTSQLLAFSRQSPLSQDIHDVSALFEQVQTLSERLLPANIELQHHVKPWTSRVRVDATQLEVALINLIINSRDAMPKGGKLLLGAKDQDIRTPPTASATPGTYVCIELTDEGGGIPNELIDKVTEPFFTTKPVGKGSGLGLSMVKGFAEQSGGFLQITTVPKISTTVCICLPAKIS